MRPAEALVRVQGGLIRIGDHMGLKARARAARASSGSIHAERYEHSWDKRMQKQQEHPQDKRIIRHKARCMGVLAQWADGKMRMRCETMMSCRHIFGRTKSRARPFAAAVEKCHLLECILSRPQDDGYEMLPAASFICLAGSHKRSGHHGSCDCQEQAPGSCSRQPNRRTGS